MVRLQAIDVETPRFCLGYGFTVEKTVFKEEEVLLFRTRVR
jgi:hypothetical protein